jgi:hypothetical protein
MLMYTLICLLFVLIGITGFQFVYMFYFDRLDRERKQYVRSLERRSAKLLERLKQAEARVAAQDETISRHMSEHLNEDETWADVIEEH